MNSRQKDILQILEHEGEAAIKELARRLRVSEMTIHRDVDYLQEQRYVYKKRGAAVFVESGDRDRSDFYADEKHAIGVKTAALLKDGQSIIFDNSTTALACAKVLDKTHTYTFYSTSIEMAKTLSRYKKSVLYCSGGYFFSETKGFVGTQAENFVTSVSADVCIIGASGISVEGGITTPYPMHTSLQRAIISSAKTRIVVCDRSKFDKIAMEKIADLGDIDMIVTDSGVSDEIIEKIEKHTTVIRV